MLLDRDGVINIDHGYVGFKEQFEFKPGVFPFLRALGDRGYRLAVLTNQSGVARGLYSPADFWKLTTWMIAQLAMQGITVDLVLACFNHPSATEGTYSGESFWRKPNPGMVLQAIQELRLNSSRSCFLGDQLRDLEAAARGNIRQRYLLSENHIDNSVATAVHSFDDVLRRL